MAWGRADALSATSTTILSPPPRKFLAFNSSAANFMPSDAGTPTNAAPPVSACRITTLRSAARTAWEAKASPLSSSKRLKDLVREIILCLLLLSKLPLT